MEKQPTVYIMAGNPNGTLYTGVTSNLVLRVHQHKHPTSRKNFTAKYQCTNLVYYEFYEEMLTAIQREKQIKSGSRSQKFKLIEKMNPNWYDLYDKLIGRNANLNFRL